MPAGASNVIVRGEVLKRLGGFDTHVTHLPDWDLWVRLAGMGPSCLRRGSTRRVSPPWRKRLIPNGRNARGARWIRTTSSSDRRSMPFPSTPRAPLPEVRSPHGSREPLSPSIHAISRRIQSHRHRHGCDDCSGSLWVRSFAADTDRPRSKWAARRLQAARRSDPNAAWKAQAQAWIDELPR